VLVCNHVSFIDVVLMKAASPRPIVFIMDHRIYKTPGLSWFFKLCKTIPVAPKSEDPEAYEHSFAVAQRVLKDGDLLGIFPEGGITRDGTLGPFKPGILKILAHAKEAGVQPPVIPMALTNMWGSYFSRIEKDGAMTRPFRRGMLNRVGLNIGEPVPAEMTTPELLHGRVLELLKSNAT
jgi:1-acyl-sn-glycerol-3-phosphate acyltransferase